MAGETARRPLMCHLMSILPSVLEHNISFESVREFKLETAELVAELAEAMHRAVGDLTVEQHGVLLHHGFTLIVGGWPLSCPSDVAERVMEETDALQPMRHRFEPDLAEALLLMARGMRASS
jgi:hypothetical protein